MSLHEFNKNTDSSYLVLVLVKTTAAACSTSPRCRQYCITETTSQTLESVDDTFFQFFLKQPLLGAVKCIRMLW